MRAPTSTRKKKGKCLGHNPSYSAYSEAKPEALTSRMFLKNVRKLQTPGAQLLYFCLLPFPLHLDENREVFCTSPWY